MLVLPKSGSFANCDMSDYRKDRPHFNKVDPPNVMLVMGFDVQDDRHLDKWRPF